MKLIEVSPREGFQLYLAFDDGTKGIVDLSDLCGKGVFAAWETPGMFEQVSLAEEGHPEWPGGLDLCPDALYLQLTQRKPSALFPHLHGKPFHA